MKKVKGLFLAALAATAMFTSCGPDEDALAPEIKFVNYDGSDLTVNKGDTIDFTFQAIAGSAKMESAPTVLYAFGTNVATPAKSTSKVLDNGYEITLDQVLNEVGVYTFTIYAADKDEKVDSATVKVTVKDAAVALTTKGEFTLGASGASAGSYYSLTDGVLTSAVAETKASKVTFVYNFNTTDKAFIMSGTEASNATVQKGATVTKFAKVTGVTFATATDSDIAAVTPTATKLTGLEVNDLIVFLAADGTKGLIQIKALVAAVDGTTTVVVKIK